MDSLFSADDHEYWFKVQREAILAAIVKCEEAAKQLIALNALLITLYSGIVSFNDVLMRTVTTASALLFAAPFLLLLVSLYFATQVIVPRAYPVGKDRQEPVGSEEIERAFDQIREQKLHWLQYGYGFLCAAMVIVSLLIVVYLLFVPQPPVT